MTETRYAVVGGGIVGASVAYHLGERSNESITVYERGELASETTFKSTAMIGVAGPDPHRRMKEYGFRLYNEFLSEPVARPRYRQSGRLRVATSTDGAATLEELAAASRRAVDAPRRAASREAGGPDATKFAHGLADYVPGEKLREQFILPALDTERIEGALYRPLYGHVLGESRTLGPRELAFEFVERARSNGVEFETGTEVTDVVMTDGRVTGIETNGAEIVDVDEVVCAAGPWNPSLTGKVGLDIPVERVLSPVFALELDRPLPCTMPTIKSHESSVGLHSKRDDTVLVTHPPDEAEGGAGYDPGAGGDDVPDAYRRTALRWAERLMPRLRDATLADEWAGIGTSTPDGNPIVGWTSIEGLSLAVTMSGIQLAPAVGDVVSRQLLEGEPTEYYDAVSISRFEGFGDCRTDV